MLHVHFVHEFIHEWAVPVCSIVSWTRCFDLISSKNETLCLVCLRKRCIDSFNSFTNKMLCSFGCFTIEMLCSFNLLTNGPFSFKNKQKKMSHSFSLFTNKLRMRYFVHSLHPWTRLLTVMVLIYSGCSQTKCLVHSDVSQLRWFVHLTHSQTRCLSSFKNEMPNSYSSFTNKLFQFV